MKLKDWNKAQIIESMSNDNRYFFWKKYGYSGSDEELVFFYAVNGGASGFAERMKGERDVKPGDDK